MFLLFDSAGTVTGPKHKGTQSDYNPGYMPSRSREYSLRLYPSVGTKPWSPQNKFMGIPSLSNRQCNKTAHKQTSPYDLCLCAILYAAPPYPLFLYSCRQAMVRSISRSGSFYFFHFLCHFRHTTDFDSVRGPVSVYDLSFFPPNRVYRASVSSHFIAFLCIFYVTHPVRKSKRFKC